MKVLKKLASLALVGAVWSGARSQAAVLLNDTWADGTRTNTALPTDSAVYIGQSAANGSNSVTPGHLNFTLPTNSLKVWTYFTSDNSTPDANQPHNAVTTMNVGDTLTASMSFSVTGVGATTGKNFRLGLFLDPTDARVQADTNSDGGGGTSPWQDATGYAVQLPISSASGNSPILLEKRTTSNTSLLGSSGAFTAAPSGGTAYALANGTTYTLQLSFNEVSTSDMAVTASLLQGATVLSTNTVHDTGAAFGGTAVAAGLPGNQSIYSSFDQFFHRNSDNTQSATVDFTNFQVQTAVPEPASLGLLVVGGSLIRRKARAR